MGIFAWFGRVLLSAAVVLLGLFGPVRAQSDAEGGGLLAGRIASPDVPPGEWSRSRVVIAGTLVPPVIDGVIDDAAWKTATRARGFYRLGGTAPVTEQTEAWICADKKNLYVAFHCLDREPGKIRASETQRGSSAVYGDDHVSVDIDAQNSRRNYSSFLATARGTQRESLEGGTADNIAWAGDWKAAARLAKNGWTAELAIPFALLRYPRGTQSFGISLTRRLARETNPQVWPYVPPAGQTGGRAPYMGDFSGFSPPFLAPRPTILPYLLVTGGEGASVREGLDVKYPISTTITGVATLFPDFKTIEQDVARINFSYNEQFVNDRRPFFAEGADYLPNRDLFYSRRIEGVDEGIKIVGKQGATAVGLVGATANGPGNKGRSSVAANFRRDLGLFSRVGLSLVADNRNGVENNRVGRVSGEYGWQTGATRFRFTGQHAQSFQAGTKKGGNDDVSFRIEAPPGKPRFRVSYIDIAPDFVTDLGFVPEKNRRGWTASAGQFNQFDKGWLEFYDLDLDLDTFQRHNGGFFRNEASGFVYVQSRHGEGINLGVNRANRRENDDNGIETLFNDLVREVGVSWNNRTLFQRGGLGYEWGRQAGKPYTFVSAGQGFLVSRSLSFQVNLNRQNLGEEQTTQTIVTGTLRLSDTQTISGRLVQQSGVGGNGAQDEGVTRGANLYFAFAQRVRTGADLFLLVGDPNSPKTRGQVTLKLLRPY